MTKIQWTNKTWNIVVGCDKTSEGCQNCYAEKFANRLAGELYQYGQVITNGKWNGKTSFVKENLQLPLKWKKPRLVFVSSMGDLFHDTVRHHTLDNVFEVMGYCQKHIFQLLTKRPKNALRYSQQSPIFNAWTEWGNIWIGATTENQKYYEKRIIDLLAIKNLDTKYLSCEPLLGPIDLHLKTLHHDNILKIANETNVLKWVIVGCESGNRRRETKIKWIEDIVDQCQRYQVPVFVKQVEIDGKVLKDINDFPKHLQIQEYPKYHMGDYVVNNLIRDLRATKKKNG